MKYLFALVLCGLSFSISAQNTQIPAFPGAEGFGKYTTGGRGGKVYIVTNLNDSGFGSLRWALEAVEPRIVVFEVSGNIELKSQINIRNGNLTIAGQTAPGEGVTLKNYPLVIRNAQNIIVRFIRSRMGDLFGFDGDSFTIRQDTNGSTPENIIVDHCSFSWGTDGTLDITDAKNITVQNTIISESLNPPSFSSLMSGRDVSFYKVVWSNGMRRNPQVSPTSSSSVKSGIFDIRNCVVYNWGQTPIIFSGEVYGNIINSYFKSGPATNQIAFRGRSAGQFFLYAQISNSSGGFGKAYLDGNFLNTVDLSNDQWLGVELESRATLEDFENFKNKSNSGTYTIFPIPEGLYSQTLSAKEAYEMVLATAGASLFRDAVDERIISEIRTGITTFRGSKTGLFGIIDSQTDVGGWPKLKALPAPKDTDRDGMPDTWEIANGLDPNKADHNGNDLHPYYTNIEVYINSLVAHIMDVEEERFEIKVAAEPKEAGRVIIKFDE